jgi:uncharacterized repeat protein (TIGR02543 family)
MKKRIIAYCIFLNTLLILLAGCDGMASLFHGPEPAVTYTVTFDANGASGAAPTTQTVDSGTVIRLPDKGGLTSAGNIFVGWNESSSGSGTTYAVGASITVTKNMIFYAQWLDSSTPQYTVTFNANGATGGSPPAAQTVYSSVSITIPNQGTLVYTGKTFDGWNTNANGAGTNYAPDASFPVTTNITLYAKWRSEVQYTVTYHANGATGTAPAAQTIDPGTIITLPGAGNLTYSGKAFDGWNTNSDGTGDNYAADASFTVTTNITLYAKWRIEVKYTVTYNANGATGTVPATQMVDPETVITLPGAGGLTSSGKTFDGWNTNAGGTGTPYVAGASYTVTANATLYAQWSSAPVVPEGSTLAEKLAYIADRADDGTVYDIMISENEYLDPTTVETMGRNVTINLHSVSAADIKSIQLERPGSLFVINSNVTLKLSNIILKGVSSNNVALVTVGNSGSLVMDDGAKITMNTSTGGTTHIKGGGVYLDNGTMVMNGGEISYNTVYAYWADGGGIFLENNSTLILKGGIISNNNSTGDRNFERGGGISVGANSTVTMNGGILSNNTSNMSGGGVFVAGNGTFIKRHASGTTESGIIYGGTGAMANTGTGSALYRENGTLHRVERTLGVYDEITSASDEGWE